MNELCFCIGVHLSYTEKYKFKGAGKGMICFLGDFYVFNLHICDYIFNFREKLENASYYMTAYVRLFAIIESENMTRRLLKL